MSAIDEALVAGKISRFRAWWERFVCGHTSIIDAHNIVELPWDDGIEKGVHRLRRCQRCGAHFTLDFYRYSVG